MQRRLYPSEPRRATAITAAINMSPPLAVSSAQLWRRLVLSMRAALDLVRLWRERSRQRAQLASFDDRMLRDIGITRNEARREYAKPFWRG